MSAMRIGFLSDAHGNAAGFARGLETLRGAGAERICFLGDAVGYIPDARVVRHIMEENIFALKGNHEAMLSDGGYPQAREAVYRLAETRRTLSSAELALIESWPDHAYIETADGRCLVVHGSPDDYVYGYVYPDTALEGLCAPPTTSAFMGNTHRPFVRRCEGTLYVNVGSCGLPRDETALGCVALFDTKTDEARLLTFSLAAAARGILARYDLDPSVTAYLARMADRDGG